MLRLLAVLPMAGNLLRSSLSLGARPVNTRIRRIRSLVTAHGREIPAVALSAYARPYDRLEALRAGFNAHVAKPIDPAELIATVANLAGRA